jgi:hypothetical protein
MDDHFWLGFRFFYDVVAGAKYVYNCGKVKAADGKILRNQIGGSPWFPGSFLLYFRGTHVFSKENSGKTGVVGKIEAAEIEIALSRLHSWFYSASGGARRVLLSGRQGENKKRPLNSF